MWPIGLRWQATTSPHPRTYRLSKFRTEANLYALISYGEYFNPHYIYIWLVSSSSGGQLKYLLSVPRAYLLLYKMSCCDPSILCKRYITESKEEEIVQALIVRV